MARFLNNHRYSHELYGPYHLVNDSLEGELEVGGRRVEGREPVHSICSILNVGWGGGHFGQNNYTLMSLIRRQSSERRK